MKLQAVELHVTDPVATDEFLGGSWGLVRAGSAGRRRWYRATGDAPWVVETVQADAPAIGAVVFSASPAEIDAVAARARQAGVPVEAVAADEAPGSGPGIRVLGPERQVYRFIASTAAAPLPPDRDRPSGLAHAVINTPDVDGCARFASEVLGFRLSDRTRIMAFMRCNRKHHCVAYASADTPSLNHVAFEMDSLEAVMLGVGRMRDAGVPCVWGPGRHGPGNNVFGYFVAPFGGIVEYTAEVTEVGDDYRVGGPDDWKWPPGRVDHWGIGAKDNARIAIAENVFAFPG